MPKIALPHAINYVLDTLFNDEGAFPHVLSKPQIVNICVFLPENPIGYDLNRLLDFETGGIASQRVADAEMISDIYNTMKTTGGSIIYFDHWSESENDILFEFESDVKTGMWMGHVFHVINFNSVDIENKNLDLIGEFRSNSVGYLKIIFTSSVKFNFSEPINDALFVAALKSSISFYINCYDDETWIAADFKS